MAQAILLSTTASGVAGIPVAIPTARSVTIQFTPKAMEGFTGIVALDVAAVRKINTALWYSVATIGADPWFQVVLLDFSRHRNVLAFTLSFDKPYQWIRARVVETLMGSATGYIAF